jgi:RND family efflux transporter MFP subunit
MGGVRKSWLKGGWLLLGLLGAAGLAGCQRSEGKPQVEAQPVVLQGEDVVRVEPQELRSGPVLSGTLEARRSATLRAEVAGPVVEVAAEKGQPVRKGQPLARLEDGSLREQLWAARTAEQAARDAEAVAQAEQARSEFLAEAGVITQRDMERAQLERRRAASQLSEARARRTLAREQHSRAQVVAPFDGVVSERHVNAGDVVQPGAPLYTVVDPRSMRLEAQVPAEQLGEVTPGTEVAFTITGQGARTFTGHVERLNPAVDPATGQARLYVELPNTEQELLAGLYAQGRLASRKQQGLAVPLSAVDERGLEPSVLRVREGQVERVSVELGLHDEVSGQVELRSGVQPGDLVLLGPARELAEGTPVTLPSNAGER